MAGKIVPIVLVGRFTTYAGTSIFTTVPMDVSPFESIALSVWRGQLLGTSPTFTVAFQQATDKLDWASIESGDPGEAVEYQWIVQLQNKRWFRLRIALGGVGPIATCYANGYFVERTH
ncbi:MAG: hypothetical protein ACT4PV_03840 [Planctomycetaceae bacterium]